MGLDEVGFAITRVPNLTPQPFRKYYSRNKDTGEIVEHRLPADPYSLRHYLKKGFKLDPKELKAWAEGEPAKPTLPTITEGGT